MQKDNDPKHMANTAKGFEEEKVEGFGLAKTISRSPKQK